MSKLSGVPEKRNPVKHSIVHSQSESQEVKSRLHIVVNYAVSWHSERIVLLLRLPRQ